MALLYLDCSTGASLEAILAALLDSLSEIKPIEPWLAGIPEAERLQVRASGAEPGLSAAVKPDSVALPNGSGDLRPWTESWLTGAEERFLQAAHGPMAAGDRLLLRLTGHALDTLGIDRIQASPIGIASPTSRSFARFCPGLTVAQIEADVVSVTPGALTFLGQSVESFGPLPSLRVAAGGCGVAAPGQPGPSRLQAWVGERADTAEAATVQVIETNIDDMSSQGLDYTMGRLFDAGALDVFFTSIQMKKNRPATMVTVLCRTDRVDVCSRILFEETTTLGLRIYSAARRTLPRREFLVETPYGPIQVKAAILDGSLRSLSVDYDRCSAAARKHRVPLRVVQEAALEAGRRAGE